MHSEFRGSDGNSNLHWKQVRSIESSLPSPPRCRRARRSPAAPPPPLLLPLLPPAVAAAAAELGRLEAACRKGCCDSATSPNQNDQKRDGEPWFYHH